MVTTEPLQITSAIPGIPSVDGNSPSSSSHSHPIGVTMCALTELEKQGIKGKWAFIKYAQSSHVEEIRESSVSYVSAYWAPNDA
jgi:predicted class III extradiol MEMO1 family dioxygenase